MTPKQTTLNTSQLRKIIEELNNMDLEKTDYEYIKQQVQRMLHLVQFTPKKMKISRDTGNHIYRGVEHKNKPMEVSKLTYPPNNLALDFQRCNPPNKAMFYGSSYSRVIPDELNLEKGNHVIYISRWSIVKPIICVEIFPEQETEAPSPEKDLIYSFFGTKFTQPIHKTYSSQYKITSAISEVMIQDYITPPKNKITKYPTELGALIYRSVSHTSRADCSAIKPHIADECLSLDYVEEITITHFVIKK